MNLIALAAAGLVCLAPAEQPPTPPPEELTLPLPIIQYMSQAIEAEFEQRAQEEAIRQELAKYTEEEIDLICRITAAESRGEPDEGQKAVANVVLNRVASEKFPSTIREVIFQKGQFSPAAKKSFAKVQYDQRVHDNVLAVLGGQRVIPDDVMYFNGPGGLPRKRWQKIGNHTFYY